MSAVLQPDDRPQDVMLPRLGHGDTCVVIRWAASEGNRVRAGDVIAEIETEKITKITTEIESPIDGRGALAAEPGFAHLDALVVRVAPPHMPVPFSSPLEQRYQPDADQVVAAVDQLLAS